MTLFAGRAASAMGGGKSKFGRCVFRIFNAVIFFLFMVGVLGCARLRDRDQTFLGDFRKYGYDSSVPIKISNYEEMRADEVFSVFVNHLSLSTGQKFMSIPREPSSVYYKLTVVSWLLFNAKLDKAFVLYFRIDRNGTNGVHPFEIRAPKGLKVTY